MSVMVSVCAFLLFLLLILSFPPPFGGEEGARGFFHASYCYRCCWALYTIIFEISCIHVMLTVTMCESQWVSRANTPRKENHHHSSSNKRNNLNDTPLFKPSLPSKEPPTLRQAQSTTYNHPER